MANCLGEKNDEQDAQLIFFLKYRNNDKKQYDNDCADGLFFMNIILNCQDSVVLNII